VSAALKGDIQSLKYFKENGGELDNELCNYAVEGRNLECFKYALSLLHLSLSL
jgi:hypothetical protein